jgi:hypothetical protein
MLEITGSWQGRNHLWLYPGDPVRESDSTAEIQRVAQDQFTEFRYTWADGGEPQEGRLFIGQPSEEGAVGAVWFDTWHLRGIFMVLKGSAGPNGNVTLDGSYAAPEGPDWGWQITIEPAGADEFYFRMFNIEPEGEKMPAVEVKYSRQK